MSHTTKQVSRHSNQCNEAPHQYFLKIIAFTAVLFLGLFIASVLDGMLFT